MVKFDMLKVKSILKPVGGAEIIISGMLIDGKKFKGSDFIRVIGE